MTSAHDCDSGLRQDLHIAAHVEQQRRVVNLLEMLGILGIIERDDLHSRGAGFSQLLLSQFE
jgi:hypothetical protein